VYFLGLKDATTIREHFTTPFEFDRTHCCLANCGSAE
jgi:hypothetical protein